MKRHTRLEWFFAFPDFIIGFEYQAEVSQGHVRKVFRRFWWHSALGTGCITSSGYVLQPNIQEREFGRYAPTLEDLKLSNRFLELLLERGS